MERCPTSTPVLSDEWIRLQFSPACLTSHTVLRNKGLLEVRHRVQQHQWRKEHEDSHYAACLFQYEREYAVLVRTCSTFVCIDDKHRVNIKEPDAFVASAERGRQVIVHSGTRLEAADHDFTKFIIIPSVVLVCDIPEGVSGLWYTGEVIVMLKEGALEPSSPLHHSTELSNILRDRVQHKLILFVYSDGGPDYQVTYISVKSALITLFRIMDLDYFCAV